MYLVQARYVYFTPQASHTVSLARSDRLRRRLPFAADNGGLAYCQSERALSGLKAVFVAKSLTNNHKEI